MTRDNAQSRISKCVLQNFVWADGGPRVGTFTVAVRIAGEISIQNAVHRSASVFKKMVVNDYGPHFCEIKEFIGNNFYAELARTLRIIGGQVIILTKR